MAEGTLPIVLVAHLDTVNDIFDKSADIVLIDEEQDLIHCIDSCVLDDRLGVYGIICLIKQGYRPSIIFTTGEEIGGIGASEIVETYSKCPFENVNFIIELDRANQNDSVYYSCGNEHFKNYINSFGFVEAKGSFTDCLILGEGWNIAAVNLSIGYLNEHTPYEIAIISWFTETIEKVKKVLEDSVNNNIKFSYLKINKIFDF